MIQSNYTKMLNRMGTDLQKEAKKQQRLGLTVVRVGPLVQDLDL